MYIYQARRRHLKSLLQLSQRSISPLRNRLPRPGKRADARPLLKIVPLDTPLSSLTTNILLSSLSMITSLVESSRWTVIVPLPVYMELDGLSTKRHAARRGRRCRHAIHLIPHSLTHPVA